MPALLIEAHSPAVVGDKHFKIDIPWFHRIVFFFFKLEGTFRSILRQERKPQPSHRENSLEQLIWISGCLLRSHLHGIRPLHPGKTPSSG